MGYHFHKLSALSYISNFFPPLQIFFFFFVNILRALREIEPFFPTYLMFLRYSENFCISISL